ncbi:apolipoprotein N-acyltransferase [Modestobacter sp. I12A-02628]|uniref:Apolipoprotein N-acyltransferase n=1 Tax=Goekera deserti TaxID=2497753 RepID=A0A7K3WE85_9ACTN|nr:apolipoprotein N-acyltransferase [Goekera deserti]MPQ99666.1 apolipoprotein N-acyltransferase [Goekera deserti]NDI46324.1 apolipoprotein N-acyltransferase [Goekera deserti]NEL54744.1 apolipoprotein N-acyltransferase [Goekera deserti]
MVAAPPTVVEDPTPVDGTPVLPTRVRRPLWRTAVAALGGLALFLAFPEHSLLPLAVVGPAALAVAVRGERLRSGLWLGLVFGLAFLLPLLSWTGIYVGAFPWLALSVYQSLFFAVLGGGLAVVSRSRWWPLWGAAVWVADEAVRSRWILGGFPWGRLGLSQTEGPFLSLAAYGGVPLVSFAIALTGGLLAAAVVALTGARRWTAPHGAGGRDALRGAALALAGVVAVPALGALAWLPLAGPSLTEGGPTSTVAVIQGNVPRAGLDFNAQRRAVLDNHVSTTLELADAVSRGEAAQPDMVIWPENSSDIDPYQNSDAAAAITRAAEAIGAPVLVGAVVEGPGRFISNTGIVWDPVTGPGQTYVKRHPVPLAEYIPARSFFRFFSDKVDLVTRDFTKGTRVGTLEMAGRQIGDVICFEVVYDGLVSDVVDAGAGMIVVQTNNATFGYTDESAQQLAMSRVRAVEYGRTVVVAATSGISAVVAPDGSVARQSELFTSDVFVEDIAQRDQRTVAERLDAWPEYLLTALGLGALLVPAVRRRRRTPAGPDGGGAVPA